MMPFRLSGGVYKYYYRRTLSLDFRASIVVHAHHTCTYLVQLYVVKKRKKNARGGPYVPTATRGATSGVPALPSSY